MLKPCRVTARVCVVQTRSHLPLQQLWYVTLRFHEAIPPITVAYMPLVQDP